MTFNILDLFGNEHREEAQAEALKSLGHRNSCDAAPDIYEDHMRQAWHAACPSCGWRKVLSPDVVEAVAAPTRRRLAYRSSDLVKEARHMQLSERPHLN